MLRGFPAYWVCNVILALMMVFFISKVAFAPHSSMENALELVFLFVFIAFAPGTFSLIAAVVVLMFAKRPTIYIRVGTYITTVFYLFVYIALSKDVSL